MTATATWSTKDVAAVRQFDYWREVVCSAFVPLSPERVRDSARETFNGSITSCGLGVGSMSRIAAHPQIVHRRPKDIASSSRPIVYLNIQISGTSQVTQFGNEAELRAGSMTLLDTSAPFMMQFDTPFQQWSLHLDAERLRARCGSVHDLCARSLDASPALAGLIGDTVQSVWRRRDDLSDVEAQHIGHHLERLVCSTVEANSGSLSSHAELLQRCLRVIDERSADHRLTPATLADDIGVSLRLLHQLFTLHSTTAHESIADSRMDAVAQRLRSPRFGHQSVAQIAADCGVGDLSHFSRAFRARYAVSPGQYRLPHG